MQIQKDGTNYRLVVSRVELSRLKIALDNYVATREGYYKDEAEMRDLIVAAMRFSPDGSLTSARV